MFVLSNLCSIIKLGLSRRGEKVKFRLPCPNILNRIALRKGQFMKKRYNFADLKNQKFGKLTVLKRVEDKVLPCGQKRTQWLCVCECGKQIIASANNLKIGKTKSCGCLRKETAKEINLKHGLAKTRINNIYHNMKQRCKNKNSKYYGKRGITICSEWQNFEKFYDWAINNGYQDNLTIDRIDNNGNYEPANCRWVTYTEQNNNRRSNHYIEYNGIKHSIAEWSKILNINYNTLKSRIKYGWSIERVLNGI